MSTQIRSKSLETGINRIEQFRISAMNVASIVSSYGVECLPFHSEDLPHYSTLSESEQKVAFFYLNQFENILLGAQSGNINLADNYDALWSALKDFKLRQPSDLFSYLKKQDVLEIYDSSGVQIWRNFNFMRICSYTLEEMHVFPWFLRYERKQTDTDRIMKSVEKVLSSSEPKVFHEKIGKHMFEEKFSCKRYLLNASHDNFCSLFNKNNEVAGFVVTSGVDIIESRRARPLENSASNEAQL